MLKRKLYDYQKRDVEFARNLCSVLNANRMGYGKTVEGIAMIDMWQAKRVLISCPKTIMYQWQAAIGEWLGRDCVVLPKRIDAGAAEMIVIVNHEHLANGTFEKKGKYKFFHPGPRLQQYLQFQWDVIICDEIHRIKNRDAKVTRAFEKLPAKRRVGLSGTPILNKPDDLFSILHWLGVKEAGNSYWGFVNEYCHSELGPFGRSVKGLTHDLEKQKALVDLLAPYTINNPDLRLPTIKRVNAVTLKMGSKQQTLYDNAKKLLLDELPDNCTILNGMSKMIRLQQITTEPQIFECPESIKFSWIAEMCDDNPDIKLVVFSRFANAVQLLQQYLNQRGISCVAYTGDLDMTSRQAALAQFTSNPVQVLAGTIGALGTGVDGLQMVCHIGVFLDRDWSPALNEQAEDRLYRIGQNDIVDIYVLQCVGSIDKYVGNINLQKSEDIKKVLGAEDADAEYISI